MNSYTVSVGQPAEVTGQHHHHHPETGVILLPENWEKILSHLQPTDFHIAINTCPEWRQLMSPYKTSSLLPLILPQVIDYLPLESILNLRGVSKKSQIATNTLLEHHPGIRPPVSRRVHFSKLSHLTDIKFNFRRLEPLQQIQEFIETIESRPLPQKNPFTTRSLTIQLNGWVENEMVGRTQPFRHLFSNYGHHLHKICFGEMVMFGRTMETVWQLLALLPNIKSLNMLGEVQMEEEALSSLSFPNLDKLKELHLCQGFSDISLESVYILKLLSRYGKQLRALFMNNLLRSPNVTSTLLSLLVPKLTWFELVSMNSAALRKLSCVSWKLEELHVSGEDIEEFPNSTALGFLEAVNNFAGSLVSLNFIRRRAENFDIQGPLNFEEMAPLTKLKSMTFEFGNLKLGWVWEFWRVCCQNLKEVYLMTDGSLTQIEMEFAKRLFDQVPGLNKIVLLPNVLRNGVKKRVIFP